MEGFEIEGPCYLEGKVKVSGSKNSALPLLFSSLLFDRTVHFDNVPRLWDIETTLKLLETMGAQYQWNKEEGTLAIDPTITSRVAPYEWVRRMRAGILALGPMVARYGEAKVSLPGGCAIGARPVNFHAEALEKMGVKVRFESGYLHATVPNRVTGAHIVFPKTTVTGTENILTVAVLAEGETRIENAACEPEVVALGKVLMQLGADIRGLGTNVVEIRGGSLSAPLMPITIPADRIETATWIAMAVATKSRLEIEGCPADQLALVLDAFRKMGVSLESENTKFKISPSETLNPVSVETAPYPGFPTDMQAQLLVAMCFANGVSQLRETVFENRFMHVAELRRMGANIDLDGNLASVKGPSPLQGAPVMATDLRASAGLVIAALAAQGKTQLSRIYHLDRGYQRLDEKLRALGAKIRRVDQPL